MREARGGACSVHRGPQLRPSPSLAHRSPVLLVPRRRLLAPLSIKHKAAVADFTLTPSPEAAFLLDLSASPAPRMFDGPTRLRPQALLLCRLWSAATAALQTLRRGCDADYLAAQLLWRSGDVGAAAERLRGSADTRGVRPAKSCELLRMLEPWRELECQSALAYEDGECVSRRTVRWCLCMPPRRQCSGSEVCLVLCITAWRV